MTVSRYRYRPQHIPQTLIDEVYTRDGARCQYCSCDVRHGGYVMEHVIPEALGGHTARYNLVLACRACNTHKGRSVWIPNNLDALTEGHPAWRTKIIATIGQPSHQHGHRNYQGRPWIIKGTEWHAGMYIELGYLAQTTRRDMRDLLQEACAMYLYYLGKRGLPSEQVGDFLHGMVYHLATKIYSQDDVAAAIDELQQLETLVAECLKGLRGVQARHPTVSDSEEAA